MRRWMVRICVMLVCCTFAPRADAAILSLPNFSIRVQGPGTNGQVNYVQNLSTPHSYDSGEQISFTGNIWRVMAETGGSNAPFAHVSGYQIVQSSFAGFDTGIAGVFYKAVVTPQPAYASQVSGVQVPVNVSGLLTAELTPFPNSSSVLGFAEATVSVKRFSSFYVSEVAAVNGTSGLLLDANAYSQNILMTPTLPVDVTLSARGNARGQWDAYADPIFTIDPVATFDVNGQSVRYADAFFLEYSDGITGAAPTTAVPEPSTFMLFGIGTLMLAGRRWRRKR